MASTQGSNSWNIISTCSSKVRIFLWRYLNGNITSEKELPNQKGSEKESPNQKGSEKESPNQKGSERELPNQKGRPVRKFQEYKTAQHKILVKLNVKDSSNIPPSLRHYWVRIGCEKSKLAGGTEKETSKKLAWRKVVKWNETLTFIVSEEDWREKNRIVLVCCLCSDDLGMKPENIKTETSIQHVLVNKVIQFEKITVHVDVSENRKTDVINRHETSLCTEEYNFVHTRRDHVLQKLITYTNIPKVDYVPNIAIIGSGGGIRALIGMCGAMTALQDEGILDLAMYVAGLSGSAWYLLTLYAQSDKELDIQGVNTSIQQHLENGHEVQFWKAWLTWKFSSKSKPEYFTFTDTFGKMIGSLLLGEKCKQKWSEQRGILKNGSVPMPILAALHVRNKEKITDYHAWIELSPYEALIPKYGIGIDMKYFGHKFYGGYVIKEHEEAPIHFIAGICGSAYAEGKRFKQSAIRANEKPKTFLRSCRNKSALVLLVGGCIYSGNRFDIQSVVNNWILEWFRHFDESFIGTVPSWLYGISDDEVEIVEPTVVIQQQTYSVSTGNSLTLECDVTSALTVNDVYWQRYVDYNIKQIGSATNTNKYSGSTTSTPSLTIYNADQSDAGVYTCFATNIFGTGQSTTTTLSVTETVKEGDDNKKGKDAAEPEDITKSLLNILWGSKTKNTKTTPVSERDIIDMQNDAMMLADAGIAFNSPYPPVLHPSRNVDIIISFDFTDRGDDNKCPFKELIKAEKWANETNIPFPKIADTVKDYKTYKEMYIFEENNKPTIVHFVMINNKFRTHGDDDKNMRNFNILPAYSTVKFDYTEQEFNKFKSLVEFNILENSPEIKKCIKKVTVKENTIRNYYKIQAIRGSGLFVYNFFKDLLTGAEKLGREIKANSA